MHNLIMGLLVCGILSLCVTAQASASHHIADFPAVEGAGLRSEIDSATGSAARIESHVGMARRVWLGVPLRFMVRNEVNGRVSAPTDAIVKASAGGVTRNAEHPRTRKKHFRFEDGSV